MEIGGVIEWKSIDSRFVKDEVYEHISAPQWVDLSLTLTAPQNDHHDDEAWFCRPDCDHPKTVEDFFKQITPSSSPSPKRSAAASVSETIPPPPLLGEQRNQRDGTLKKRVAVTRWDKIVAAEEEEDSQNRNPNLSTPPPNYNNKPKKKEALKSSTEKTKTVDDENYRHQQHKEERNLRRTLSARNLFGGGEMLNKITEFCNELKKLTTRGGGAKEREDNTESNCSVVVDKEEKTPLLHIAKQKIRRKKKCNDDAENTIPISISIDIKSSKQHQIRTYPPTPQCFSNTNRATPPKAFKSKPPMERGILQELAAAQSSSNKDEANNNNNQDLHQDHARVRGKQHASIINPEKEAKSLDVFWFLKPCTL